MKTVLDTLDGLPDALREEYAQGDDGKYHIKLEGDVPGFVPEGEVKTTRDQLGSFRANNIKLKQGLEKVQADLKKYDGIDPTEVEKLRKTARELEARLGANTPEDIQKLVNGKVAKLEADLQALRDEKAKADAEVRRSKVEHALGDIASRVGVRDSAVADFKRRGMDLFQVSPEGKIVAMNGDMQVYQRNNTDPLTMEVWATELQADAPHLFKDSNGAGAQGSSNAGATSSGKRIVSNDPLVFGENLEAIAKGEVGVARSGQ